MEIDGYCEKNKFFTFSKISEIGSLSAQVQVKFVCRPLPCSTYWRIVWAVVNPQLDSCKHNKTLSGNFYYIQTLLNCLLQK